MDIEDEEDEYFMNHAVRAEEQEVAHVMGMIELRLLSEQIMAEREKQEYYLET